MEWIVGKYASYVICTSPRSGSTLLCNLLAATGVAGMPDSYFHKPSTSRWLDTFGLEQDDTVSERDMLRAIFQAAIVRGSGETGMFGLRLQRHSFDFLIQKLSVLVPGSFSDSKRFQAAFGRTLFVHLTRTDKVEQAISYVKAQQTGLWHLAADGTDLDRTSAPQEPVYDAQAIRSCVQDMTAFDLAWDRWFTTEGIEPLRVSYEALSADPNVVLAQVLDNLGLNREAASGIEPGVAKLADRTSRDWAYLFRSEPDTGPEPLPSAILSQGPRRS